MGICWVCRAVLLYLVPFLNLFPISVTAVPGSFLTVKSSTSWTNSLSAPHSVKFDDGSFVTIILTHGSPDLSYEYACGCGFLYNRTYNSSLFVIFSLFYGKDGNTTGSARPKIVWSANPKNPVSLDATLQLTSEGGLVLEDANGTKAWSTNISNKSVVGLNLTDNTCNLMLLDDKNATIWQSFDHPTDTLVLGQKLLAGQQLTSVGGLFSFSITGEGLFLYINSNPPDFYFNFRWRNNFTYNYSYSQFRNQSFDMFEFDNPSAYPMSSLPISKYMKLQPDGHLKVYDEYWSEALDFLKPNIGFCGYPTVCGNYSICTNEQCSCPLPINGTNYFQPINDRQPNHGCSLVTPFSCESYKNHILTELENITYFPFQKNLPHKHPDYLHISLESCKESCLKVCSCKAAIYNTSNRVGNCYLLSQIFSMMYADERDIREGTYFKVFIKVQNVPLPPQQQKHWLGIILGSSLAFVLFLLIGFFVFLFWKKETANEAEEYYLDHVPGMPTRYSYDDLQVITKNFSKELGGGGFGTVFEGTQIDNTKVAVKRLDGFNQIKKSFLAEVETIGSIHHFNLVRLIGFCAEKSHRLLVYEYMSNGSLDRWVFHKNPEMLLDWQHRKKIILDTARGLTYLHEECRQKIVHLDIKPHNILLDENFNAKVSDFGLSKLVDRDQSQVVTTMRGTPGYMAPEWLNSVITEKVDVYSFGVVVLELLCGRRNLDRSQPEEEMHLLDLFRKNIEEERLLDLVDKNSGDMQLHGKDVVNMMMVAAWCLQIDFTKRPSMSTVVKVLEGVVDVESNLDYCFSNPPLPNTRARVDNQDGHIVATTLVLPSVLSGPR